MDSTLTDQILSQLVNFLIPVALTLFSAAAAYGMRWIRSKLTAEQLGIVQHIVDVNVQAAEQLGITDQIKQKGKEKKRLVLTWIVAELDKQGIRADPDALDAMIEAAVYQYTQAHPAPAL